VPILCPASTIEGADPADSLTALFCRNSSHSFFWFQLNDVMNFIPPFARRLEPGQNDPDHTVFDGNDITDFELRFVGAAYKSLAWCVPHPSILTQHGGCALTRLREFVPIVCLLR
jgi:hypothetical protein